MTAVDDSPYGLVAPDTLAEAGDAELWQSWQQSYWDAISDRYDQLYMAQWSDLENRWVQRRLSFVRTLPAPTVLDLGCGTGLGLRIIRRLNRYAHYVGVDISAQMVGTFAEANGAANVHLGSMDDLGFLNDGQVHVVISLFSSV